MLKKARYPWLLKNKIKNVYFKIKLPNKSAFIISVLTTEQKDPVFLHTL